MLIRCVAHVSLVACLCGAPLTQVMADRLVFGSFRALENAQNWAQKLTTTLGNPISRASVEREGVTWHRVQSADMDEPALQALMRRAAAAGVTYWRLRADGSASTAQVQRDGPEPRLTPPARITRQAPVPPVEPVDKQAPEEQEAAQTRSLPQTSTPAQRTRTSRAHQQLDVDLGLETRLFAERGLAGAARVSGSVSLQPEYYLAWADDRKSFTFTPFVRLDSEDSERSHADIRELFYSYVGTNWDVHVGAKRVFWGVTEFHHLVDIINQTDLVENIDGEDKLGQPMVQLSMVRDWGIVDAYVLTGFRERTFPGRDGRLGLPYKISGSPRYESGAEELRTDFALRWSHHVGAFEVGLHHFSGTSREPMFDPLLSAGGLELRPYYPVIDQTGVDAQAIYGDWAFKFEGMTRSGFGDRYSAANVGVEKTLVGVFGSSADLGLVMEYMYDERGEDAFNTLFERDVAIGGRLAMNDFADTQALLGVIFDTQRDNYTISLEASRQLSASWQLNLEGRIFAGGKHLSHYNTLLVLTDPDYKHAWLDSEDYLQVEIKKYF